MKSLVNYINEGNGEMNNIIYIEDNNLKELTDALDITVKSGLFFDPEGYTLTNNGAYDLQQKGYNGIYVWCGFRHSNSAANRKLKAGLAQFTKKVADEMQKIYGGKPVVEDFTKSSDMYRIYINKYTKKNI